jgi:5'-nucleotidase
VVLPELPAGSEGIAAEPPSVEEAAPAEPAPAPAEEVAPAPAEAAPTPPAEAGPAEAGSHVVQPGDTYWDIAVKVYGDGLKWRLIADANPQYRPRFLPVGATLVIPPAG